MELASVADDARSGNVARLYDETVRHHGTSPAVEYHGRTLTHAELQTESARFAGGFDELGLEPGSTLLVYLPNCPAYLIGALGAFRAGVIVSPVNPQYRTRELTHQIEDTDADGVLTHAALLEHIDATLSTMDRELEVIAVASSRDDVHQFESVRASERLVERDDEDVALLPYTSGTTGQPKGVQLTHANVRAQLTATLTGRQSVDDEAVRSLIWLPMYHITGFTHSALQPLIRGGAVYLRSAANWDASSCMELIEAESITHFVGVTAMYVDMVTAADFESYDLTCLEMAAEGGAKLSGAIQEEFETTAGVDIGEGYGLTETHGATHSQRGSTMGLKPGTVGQPTRMTDCKIVDEAGEELPVGEPGELLVRGPQVMAGYHNLPEATEAAFTEDGYFRTGDIAQRDETNYYEIVDRKKHVIVSAGYNVYPSEIEAVLTEHEAVAECAVIGVPDERRNEIPKAYVVCRPDVAVTTDQLKTYVLDTIAPYKHPREIEFVEELPRTASGKVQKYKLEVENDS